MLFLHGITITIIRSRSSNDTLRQIPLKTSPPLKTCFELGMQEQEQKQQQEQQGKRSSKTTSRSRSKSKSQRRSKILPNVVEMRTPPVV